MAEKKPLCNYSGVIKELQSGDSLPLFPEITGTGSSTLTFGTTIQTITFTTNTSFTDNLSDGEYVILHLINGDAHSITWSTTTWVSASGNIAPKLTAGDVVVFYKIGTTLYGLYVGSFI